MMSFRVLVGRQSPKKAVAFAAMWACAAWASDEWEYWPTSQIAPVGYTSAINTPTADVLPWGGATLGLTNSNPERRRTKFAGHFGSLNAGVGLLPGLELVGRLSYEGDLSCNLYDSRNCSGGQRDLSLSGKYQLPIELPLDTRLAAGFTDYGGNAAIFYRQVYGVATSTLGMLDLSLGYSKPGGARNISHPLMDGVFGSAVMRVNDRWAAVVENDTREWRAGAHYTHPLSKAVSLQAGLSRKLTDRSAQQSWQATVALNVMLGSEGKPVSVQTPTYLENRNHHHLANPTTNSSIEPAAVLPEALGEDARKVRSADLANALVDAGFSQVNVKHWSESGGVAPLWQVQAEPRRWRQSQLDAVAVALNVWRKLVPKSADDQFLLTLTYQQEPVLHVRTSARCLEGWINGFTRCAIDPHTSALTSSALEFSRRLLWPEQIMATVRQTPQDEARGEGVPPWVPQIELGPGLRNSVGTEYGLYDYSLALEAGFEVGLVPGLSWQGVYSTPVTHSDDYGSGKVFAKQAHPSSGMDTSMLSYWRSLPLGVSAQLSAGKLTRNDTGGQLDLVWMNETGRWRFGAMAGQYQNDSFKRKADPILGIAAIDGKRMEPVLVSARTSLVPGSWHIDLTAGRFFNGDQGYRLKSVHWFGDTSMSLYYRRTQSADLTSMPKRAFMGFEVSIPLGPKAATSLGPISLRGRDRFKWGIETKVGESNNYLTQGYGVVPALRHGLASDVTDFDRNGAADLASQLYRMRSVLTP